MQNNSRAKIVLAFVAVYIISIAIITFANRMDIEHEAPMEITQLENEDFIVKNSIGNLNVGLTDWQDATALFEGKTLGRSTVYSPECHDCYLIFTKKENILCKMDIMDKGFSTNRGITMESNFADVLNAYGSNYDKISQKNQPRVFDLIYGTDNNYIVFQFDNDHMKKIVLYRNNIQ